MGKLRGKFVILIDVERLLAIDDIQQLVRPAAEAAL
jgi:hypothetical protein